jgi:hypothetical protein
MNLVRALIAIGGRWMRGRRAYIARALRAGAGRSLRLQIPRALRAGATCALVLLGILMAQRPPVAQALPARGHVFAFSFGAMGSGADDVLEPGGVAVDEATGDIYVVDRGNERIDRFGPAGEFIAAWGWGVKDGKAEYEVCERTCQTGIAGAGKGQLDSPEAIAVDNSANADDPSKGDVYVVTDARVGHGRLVKYTAGGEVLTDLKQGGTEPSWEGQLDGLAVDGSGSLWVYRGVEAEGFLERFSDATKNKFEEPVLETGLLCPRPGIAVASTGDAVYVDHERENRSGACPTEEGEVARPTVATALTVSGETVEATSQALSPLQTNGLANDPASGETILDNGPSIAAFTAQGEEIQDISLPGQGALGAGVAASGATDDIYASDSSRDQVDVFEPERAGKPTVRELGAENLTPTSVRLSALVDPHGADTHYFFAYGAEDCTTNQSSCTDVPKPPGADIGSAFADQPAGVEVTGLQPSTTYYYRVIATNSDGEAEGSETFGTITTLPSAAGVLPDGRAWELVSPADKDGSGIEPLRNEGGLIQAAADGNSISYVANGPIVPEPEGSRAPYPTQAIATRTAAGWSSQQIVTPRTKGEGFIPGEAPEYRFFSEDLSLSLVQPDNQALVEPLEQPPLAPEATEKTMYVRNDADGSFLPLVTPEDDTADTAFGEKLDFVDATPDLSHVVLASGVPLVAGASAGLYEWQSGQPLLPVSILPDGEAATEATLGANNHNVRGAISQDGSRIFWTGDEEVQNGAGTEVVRHLFMTEPARDRTIQVDAAVAPIAEPGEEEGEVGFQAASSDGSRVFFTDTARLTEDSNLAPVAGSTTNPADLYECDIVEEAGKPACRLQDLTVDRIANEQAGVLDVVPGVSEDGSSVYFVANGVLAPGASPGSCVRINIETPPAGATCNLYEYHDGAITFIATLSDEDSPDWGRSEAVIKGGESSVEPIQDLSDLTARVSPDGNYFAFMSNRSLTGYDNVDANPAADGARDEEVYLYDAATKLLTCVSCNPSGAQPQGVFDTNQSGEGLGLLVDRREDWAFRPHTAAPTAHWLAGSIPGWTPLGISSPAQALRQPRYLNDSGRVFFDSADPLIAVAGAQSREELVDGSQTQVGIESVYEFEPDAVGGCRRVEGCIGLISSGTSGQESAFVDASENGDDAFFVTAQPLVAADRDTNFDLYDARVCSSESPCLTSEGASSEACQTTDACRPVGPPAPASLSPSGSSILTGPSSKPAQETRAVTETRKPGAKPKPLTRAQKLAGVLRRCRTRFKHAKTRRVACERQARKAYVAKHTRRKADAGRK